MIALGCDHAGVQLKASIAEQLASRGLDCRDYGTYDEASCDYPDFAEEVGRAVVAGEAERGILICGTGVGVSIAANKIAGARAACVSESYSARMARAHNDANVLCVGERIVGPGLGAAIVKAFLEAPFEGGRHERRVKKIADLER